MRVVVLGNEAPEHAGPCVIRPSTLLLPCSAVVAYTTSMVWVYGMGRPVSIGWIRVLLAAFCIVGLAGAQTQATTIRWTAPAGCPPQADLVRQVERFLGQDLDERRDQVLAIQGDMDPSASGYALTLGVESSVGTSTRRLEHVDCEKLTEAAALVIAIAIDPERVQAVGALPGPPPPPPVDLAPEPAPDSQPLDPPVPQPIPWVLLEDPDPVPTRSPRSWSATMDLYGLVGVGLLPNVQTGAEIQPALEIGRFRGAASVGRWPSRSELLPGVIGVGVDLDAWTLGAAGCGLAGEGVQVSVCAGPQWVTLRGQGRGTNVTDARSRRANWAAAQANIGLAHEPTASLRVVAQVTSSVHLARPRFGVLVDGEEVEVFRPNRVMLSAGVGLGGRF